MRNPAEKRLNEWEWCAARKFRRRMREQRRTINKDKCLRNRHRKQKESR